MDVFLVPFMMRSTGRDAQLQVEKVLDRQAKKKNYDKELIRPVDMHAGWDVRRDVTGDVNYTWDFW